MPTPDILSCDKGPDRGLWNHKSNYPTCGSFTKFSKHFKSPPTNFSWLMNNKKRKNIINI